MRHLEVTTVLLVALLLSFAAARCSAALLENGDFEKGPIGAPPQGWHKIGWDKPLISVQNDPLRQGHVMQVEPNGTATYHAGLYVKVAPGRRYCLSWYARTNGTAAGEVQVRGFWPGVDIWYGDKGARILSLASFKSPQWEKYSLQFTAPLGKGTSDKVIVMLGPGWYKNKGWVRYDDVTLEEVKEPVTNLLVNGDFENGWPGFMPPGWQTYGWGPRPVEWKKDETGRSKGVVQVEPNGKSWHYIGQPVNIVHGARYRLRWRARTSGAVGGWVIVRAYNPGRTGLWGAKNARQLASKTFSSAKWVSYSMEFIAPPEEDARPEVVVMLGTSSWKVKGWVRYDDVVLEKIGDLNDDTAAGKTETGNLILNGSFEFGMRDWILHKDLPIWRNYRLDATEPLHGRYCLTWDGPIEEKVGTFWLISNWFRVRPGHRYVSSLSIRGSRDGQGVRFRLYDSNERALLKVPWKTATLKKGKWKTFQQEVSIPKGSPIRKMALFVSADEPYSLDAVRVSEDGPAADDVIRNESVGVDVEMKGGAFPAVFDYRTPGRVLLEARNVGSHARRLTVQYKVVELLTGATLKSGRYKAALKPGTSRKRTVMLDTARRGRFDFIVSVLDEKGRLIRRTITPFAVLKPVRSASNSPFGTNGNLQNDSTKAIETDMALLRRYGFSRWRLWFAWILAQDKPDSDYSWWQFDRQVKTAVENGYDIMASITVTWDRDSWRTRMVHSDDLGLWKKYVRTVVSRYKDRIKAWSVMNEWPLSPKEKLDDYLRVLKATWEAAKQADPDCLVLAGSGSSGPKRHADVKDFLAAGGGEYCDVIEIHPYPEFGAPVWNDLEGTVRKIRRWSRDAGFKHDVWLTEGGNYTSQGGYAGDGNNIDVASTDTQGFLIAWANRTWICLHAAEIGLNSNRGMYDPPMVPNAVVCAANVLAEQILGADAGTCRWLKMPKSIGGIYGVRFRRGKDTVAAVWCLGEPPRRKLLLPFSGKAALTDMMGNAVALTRENGRVAVPITNNIAYVSFLDIRPEEVDAVFGKAGEVSVADARDMTGVVQAGNVWAAGKPPSGGPFRPDAEGFIRDWLVMGPFANPGQRGFSAGFNHDFLLPIGGEAVARLHPGTSVIYQWPAGRKEWGKSITPRCEVKAAPVHSRSAAINLASILSPKDYVVAYVCCDVIAPEETKARLSVGSDDGVKVWLNNRLVLNRRVYRGLRPDDDQVDVTLRKGANHLMVKVDTDKGGWGFCLRFLGENNLPLKTIETGW